MTRLRHRHWSGLWKASAEAWQHFVARGCTDVEAFTCTETTVQHPDAPEGFWHCWLHAAKDASAYLSKAAFPKHPKVSHGLLSTTRYTLGGKTDKAPLTALVVEAEHVSGRWFGFIVIHWPSAIEAEIAQDQKGRKIRFPRIKAFFEGLRAVHRLKREMRHRHPGILIVIPADWNLDRKKPWVRAFFHTAFPAMQSAWKRMPASGTHGSRLIDASLYSRGLSTKGSELEVGMEPFDHRPYVTTYRF